MKIFYILFMLFSTIRFFGQGVETNKQIDEVVPFCEKGNYYLSAFPVITIFMDKPPYDYFSCKLGHGFSIGYFLIDRLSVNVTTNQVLGIGEIENDGSIPSGSTVESASWSLRSSPAFSLRLYMSKKRFTPFLETGLIGTFIYFPSSPDFLYNRFIFVASCYGGIGLNVPLSRFNFSLTAKYLYPVYKYNLPSNSELIGTFSLHFEPRISYFFNRKKG